MINKQQRLWLFIGGLTCAIAVILGAFGAHALESVIHQWYESEKASRKLASWETGVRYHFFHGLGLIAIGLLPVGKTSRSRQISASFFMCGVILFSGGLYGWVLFDQRIFVMVVPVGGFSFILGWFTFVWCVTGTGST